MDLASANAYLGDCLELAELLQARVQGRLRCALRPQGLAKTWIQGFFG